MAGNMNLVAQASRLCLAPLRILFTGSTGNLPVPGRAGSPSYRAQGVLSEKDAGAEG
jgi:hypothetical protein